MSRRFLVLCRVLFLRGSLLLSRLFRRCRLCHDGLRHLFMFRFFRFCRRFHCFFRASSGRLFRSLNRYRLRLLFLESCAAVRAKELAFPRFAAAMLAFAHGHFSLFQSETFCSPVACKKAPVSKRHRRLAQNLWQCCQDFPFYLNICCAKPQSFRLFRALLL